jgi:hypothetical protein
MQKKNVTKVLQCVTNVLHKSVTKFIVYPLLKYTRTHKSAMCAACAKRNACETALLYTHNVSTKRMWAQTRAAALNAKKKAQTLIANAPTLMRKYFLLKFYLFLFFRKYPTFGILNVSKKSFSRNAL